MFTNPKQLPKSKVIGTKCVQLLFSKTDRGELGANSVAVLRDFTEDLYSF